MANPEVKSGGGIWRFHFPDEGIIGTVSRLRQHSDHVGCEIILANNTADPASHLHQANFNLSSTPAKTALAKVLAAQRKDVNWNTLLEQVRVRVLTDFRRGEPLMLVGDLPVAAKPRYRLEPLCPEGRLASLYGAGGDGKSLVAVLGALCVQMDKTVGPLKPLQGNALLLDYENDWETVNELIWAFRRGMGWPAPTGFHYRHCSQPLVDEIQEVTRIIVEENIGYGILDSVGMACVGEDTSASYDNVAIRMLRALRSTKIAWLLIDHRPHREDKQFGSEYKRNESRSQWAIRKTQQPDSAEMIVGLYHKKVNQGRLRKPFGLQFLFHGEAGDPDFSIVVKPSDLKGLPELQEGLARYQQIKAILEDKQPQTVSQIAIELDMVGKEKSIGSTLTRYKKVFLNLTGGRKGEEAQWGLVDIHSET